MAGVWGATTRTLTGYQISGDVASQSIAALASFTPTAARVYGLFAASADLDLRQYWGAAWRTLGSFPTLMGIQIYQVRTSGAGTWDIYNSDAGAAHTLRFWYREVG